MNSILVVFSIFSAICSSSPKSFFMANGAAIPALSAVAQSPNKTTFDAALFKQIDVYVRSNEYQRHEQEQAASALVNVRAALTAISENNEQAFRDLCLRVAASGDDDSFMLDLLGPIIERGWEGSLSLLNPNGSLAFNSGGPAMTAYILAWRSESVYGMREYLEDAVQRSIAKDDEFVTNCLTGPFGAKSDRSYASLNLIVNTNRLTTQLAIARRLALSSDSNDHIMIMYAAHLGVLDRWDEALQILRPMNGKCHEKSANDLVATCVRGYEEQIAQRDYYKKK